MSALFSASRPVSHRRLQALAARFLHLQQVPLLLHLEAAGRPVDAR
jgi:hypothetical protein